MYVSKQAEAVCSHGEGEAHDCDYVARRNRLIPMAMVLALRDAPRESSAWSTAFHDHMNRLAREKGLLG